MAPNARALTAHAAAEHRTTNQGRPHSGETERGTNRKTRRRMFGRSAARATARCAALARAHLRTAPQQRFVRRRRADYCSAKFACTRSRAVTLDSARARARPRASHARCSLCALKLRSYGRAFLTGLGGVRGFRLSSPPRSAAPRLYPRYSPAEPQLFQRFPDHCALLPPLAEPWPFPAAALPVDTCDRAARKNEVGRGGCCLSSRIARALLTVDEMQFLKA